MMESQGEDDAVMLNACRNSILPDIFIISYLSLVSVRFDILMGCNEKRWFRL